MNHDVAVRAERDHIVHRIGQVIFAHRMQWNTVRDVDVVSPGFPVKLLKAEAASLAPAAMVLKAGFSGGRVALIGIHEDLRFCTFAVRG